MLGRTSRSTRRFGSALVNTSPPRRFRTRCARRGTLVHEPARPRSVISPGICRVGPLGIWGESWRTMARNSAPRPHESVRGGAAERGRQKSVATGSAGQLRPRTAATGCAETPDHPQGAISLQPPAAAVSLNAGEPGPPMGRPPLLMRPKRRPSMIVWLYDQL